MTWEEREVRRLLKEHGATLERQNKHDIYRFPDNSTIALASTMSDERRGWRIKLAELRNRLGLNDPNRGAEGERRERRTRHEMPAAFTPTVSTFALPTLKGQLHQARGKRIKHPVHGRQKRVVVEMPLAEAVKFIGESIGVPLGPHPIDLSGLEASGWRVKRTPESGVEKGRGPYSPSKFACHCGDLNCTEHP